MYIWYLLKYIFSIFLSSFIFITFLKFKWNSKFRKFYSKFLSKLYVLDQFRTFLKFSFRSIWVPFEDVLLTGHKNIHILKNIHFVVQRSYRFPHRNHYGHHFNHVSNPSHEQFLFENRAVEADVPHNADGANGSIKRMIWIYNCITCYSEICTAVKITARRTW